MTKNNKKIPSVLSFEKKLVPSDGFLYGTNWNDHNSTKSIPLKLIEKSIRGTISNRLKPAIQNDSLKLNAEVEKANLQKIDSCALSENQDTLHLHFTLKVLGNIEKPSVCNNEEFNKSYVEVTKKYIEEEKFIELAKRYATNIVNARYLWRNRVGAEKIEVVVKINDVEKPLIFDAKTFSLRDFDSDNSDLQILTNKIAEALRGELPYLLITIDTYALVGYAQEVYPSEELVLDKGKGDKSKILYEVNNVAAMHSQKIGNALRTIDTWYPEFYETNLGPIAIEPYGAVTTLGKAFRSSKNKADFYSLFDKFALGEKLDDKNQEHYVMAVLIRGGIFGESSKESSKKEE